MCPFTDRIAIRNTALNRVTKIIIVAIKAIRSVRDSRNFSTESSLF